MTPEQLAVELSALAEEVHTISRALARAATIDGWSSPSALRYAARVEALHGSLRAALPGLEPAVAAALRPVLGEALAGVRR